MEEVNTQSITVEGRERAMLDQLLADSRLYRGSKEFKGLLDFVVRLRAFAPFNAMLLHVQKPGLTYAASAKDWRERFNWGVKEEARPLLILWPFGPVSLVYDVQDTERPDGSPVPKDIATFWARGPVDRQVISSCIAAAAGRRIEVVFMDGGDAHAGAIRKKQAKQQVPPRFKVQLNQNHPPATHFCTLAHELAHLCLGHLGPDKHLRIPERKRKLSYAERELEAEAVAYLVCARNGVDSASNRYLANFVKPDTTVDHLDLYQIMRAAGQVEQFLGLAPGGERIGLFIAS